MEFEEQLMHTPIGMLFRKGDILYLAVFEEQRASGVTHLTDEHRIPRNRLLHLPLPPESTSVPA